MQFYGRAEDSARQIVDVFRSGRLPAALAPIFIRRGDDAPCRGWSWSNQLLVALAGYADARGIRQWNQVGRRVRQGERCRCYILAPCLVKRKERDEESGEESEREALISFRSVPVFGIDQTAVFDQDLWDQATGPERESQRFIDGLLLVEVARAWGLSVETYSGHSGTALGTYRPGRGIALGVKNLSTWAHELIHAADDRRGTLTEHGQHVNSETVAELGGAVLLAILGYEHDADLGGCWQYIESYAGHDAGKIIRLCEKLLNRVCSAVALVLDTAQQLAAAPVMAVA